MKRVTCCCARVKSGLLLIFLFFSTPVWSQAKSNSDNYSRILHNADSLRISQKYGEAEIAYRQALVFNSKSADAIKGLGKIAYELQNWPDFHKWFEMALDFNPEDNEAKEFLLKKSKVMQLVLEGDSLRSNQKYKQAKKSYDRALSYDNGFAAAYKGLGKLSYEQGDWDKFHKWLNKALELDPDDIEALELISNNPKYGAKMADADRLLSKGDVLAAEELYKEALDMNRQSVAALSKLGQTALRRRDWGDAKGYYKKVSDLAPDNLQAPYGLGIAYRETGKFKVLLLKRRDFNKSRDYFNSVIAADSTYQDVLYQRALLSKLMKRWSDAVLWAHHQFRLKPQLPHANAGLHRLYKLALIHEATDKLDVLLQKVPAEWAVYIRGEQQFMLGNYPKADSIFTGLLSEISSVSKTSLYLSLARSAMAQENPEAANTYFNNAIDAIDSNVDAEYMFETCKYIFTDNELAFFSRQKNAKVKQAFFRSLWTARDPTPASQVNERAVEHLKRLNYSERNYWFDDVRSWASNPDKSSQLTYPQVYLLNEEFNDKGLIYLRHGTPDEVAVTPDRNLSNESWHYYQRADRGKLIFHFVIDSQAGSGNNWQLTPVLSDRFILQDRLGWDTKMDQLYMALSKDLSEQSLVQINSLETQLADVSRQTVHYGMSTDFHTWEKKQEQLEAYYHISNLKGFGNKTLTQVYLALPLEALGKSNNGSYINFEHGAGIYDRNWKRLTRSFEKVHLSSADSARIFNQVFIQKYDFHIEAGNYNLAIYAKDEGEQRIGGWNIQATVPAYSGQELTISDPIPAYDVQPATISSVYTRGDVSIIPNPSKKFSLNSPVFLYYEIYNLSKDEEGDTRYEIETEMTLQKKKKSGLGKLFGFIGGGSKKSISIKDERHGKHSEAVEYTSFDVSKLDEGEYKLNVRVTDLLTKESIEKSFELMIVKD